MNAKLKTQSSKQEINSYKPQEIESKWQKKWEEMKVFSPDLEKAKRPFYNLMMFPYPSAEGMHVGNMYAFTGADVYGRFKRMQGWEVFEPIGLDGFGIHSENYAIKVGRTPQEHAQISEKNFYRQLRATGNSYDWSRTVETYDPEYYRWTQWLFIQLFKAGLAYRKKAPVNFCPSCKTVLSDEQVVKGQRNVGKTHHDVYGKENEENNEVSVCERCGTEVVKKELEQWFLKITKYADRLLNNLIQIDWVEKVKIAQKNWIGRSEGLIIKFGEIDIFTTRPETTDGATFLVLSPQHPKAKEFILKEVVDYIKLSTKKTDEERRMEKTGVFTGEYVVNPLTKKKIPIWIADYVLMGYGTGAIMAVPSEDERDREFAKKYNLPIEKTTLSAKPIGKKVVNYHLRDWLISRQRYWGPPIPMIYCEFCAKKGISGFTLTKKSSPKEDYLVSLKADSLNGWSDTLKSNISKQNKNVNSQFKNGVDSPGIEPGRFGVSNQPSRPAEPAPRSVYENDHESVNYWNSAGWFPVPEDQLPLELPLIKDYKPLGTGKSPLANHPEFYKTTCPNCGGNAKRETDVSDTFLDSAWYFLRYVSTDIDTTAFDRERVKKWLPVNMYIGGAEHSVLHLLYSRFITMALHDLGFLDFEEPFSRFYAHGLIIKDGAKMSKSKGNVVVPDQYIAKYGADTLRCYLMFLGPFNQGGDFRDSGIEGMHRFLRRVWRLASENSKFKIQNSKLGNDNLRMMNLAIKRVTEDMENLRYNTAIAALMEWYNFLSDQKAVSREEIETFLKLLAPFAPHMTEELYQFFRTQNSKLKTQNSGSIHLERWPAYDPELISEQEVVIAVQINGKVREILKVKSEMLNVKSHIEQLARESDKVKKYLEGKKIKKVIYVPGKIINFVTSV